MIKLIAAGEVCKALSDSGYIISMAMIAQPTFPPRVNNQHPRSLLVDNHDYWDGWLMK